MAAPLTKQLYPLLRKSMLSRDVPPRLGSLVGSLKIQTKSGSTYKAAVLKEFKKPLVIKSLKVPKKIKKDEV